LHNGRFQKILFALEHYGNLMVWHGVHRCLFDISQSATKNNNYWSLLLHTAIITVTGIAIVGH
jgi:hypothetical protein